MEELASKNIFLVMVAPTLADLKKKPIILYSCTIDLSPFE
jgi:hypothetical protein